LTPDQQEQITNQAVLEAELAKKAPKGGILYKTGTTPEGTTTLSPTPKTPPSMTTAEFISTGNAIVVGGEQGQYDWSKYPGGYTGFLSDLARAKASQQPGTIEYARTHPSEPKYVYESTTTQYSLPKVVSVTTQASQPTSDQAGVITFYSQPSPGFIGLGNISAKATPEPKLAINPLSLQLYQYAQTLPSEETGPFGFKYNPKGLYTIGSIFTGSIENVVSPILNIIPGKQLFEVEPGMTSISWRNLPSELTETEKKMGLISGLATEMAFEYGLAFGVGEIAGAAIGAGGSILARAPVVGEKLTKVGGVVSEFVSKPLIGAITLGAPIVALEGIKTVEMAQRGEPLQNIIGSLGVDVSGLLGFSKGFSSGFPTGQSIVNRIERAVVGGETIPGEKIVPEYVRSGEENFPKFSSEPHPPTPTGYKAMAESYTPAELKIGEGVPSYHTTPASMPAEIMVGESRHGPGMFFAPATSEHFLRMSGESESLLPGIPNIFGRPTIIYGEFEDVVASGAGKASPKIQEILSRFSGKGVLVMPVEQLEEAQAILPGGEKLVEVSGRFWANLSSGVVPIRRFLPVVSGEGEVIGISVGELASSGYSIPVSRPTTYLPSPSLPISTPSEKLSTSKTIKYESPSLPKSISAPLSQIYTEPSIISKYSEVSTSKYPEPSSPKYPKPSTIKYPSESTIKYPGTPSPKYPNPSKYYPEPSTIKYSSSPKPYYFQPPEPVYPSPKKTLPPSFMGEKKEKPKPKTELDLFGKKRVTYSGLDLLTAVFGRRKK